MEKSQAEDTPGVWGIIKLKHYKDIIETCKDRPDFLVSRDKQITPVLVSKFVGYWQNRQRVYKYFRRMYRGDHAIFHEPDKPGYKPDNRLVVNLAKYIVDTLNSYFIGIPIKISAGMEDEYASDFLNRFFMVNNFEDKCNELSKLCSIYGHAYVMIYTDENADFRIEVLSPESCCVVYDDTLSHDPMFAFTLRVGEDNRKYGSYCTAEEIVYFEGESTLNVTSREPNKLGAVSIIEFVENAEKQSAFENVASLIEGLDKVLSMKMNDFDSLADAYMKILGAPISQEDLEFIRENRIINIPAEDTNDLTVDFLSKPDGDTASENLLEHLKEYIFQTAMVANISDESFGTASGVALKYKLHPMSNLAQYKSVKFKAGLSRMFEVICNAPNYFGNPDDWTRFEYRFTQNIPSNELEETQIAQNLSGIVSQKTQLSVLSVVPDVDAEIERLDEENEPLNLTDYTGFEHTHDVEEV